MTTRERVHELIDQLAEPLLQVVLPLLEVLQQGQEEDEPLTAEDVAAIDAAKRDPRPNLTTEQLCQELGIERP